MLVIRLARTGRKKYATYRITVADSRRAVTSKFIKVIGHYNPHTKEIVVDKELAEKYMANGARPSNRVIRLFENEKIKLPKWAIFQQKHGEKKEKAEKAKKASTAKEAVSENEASVPEREPTETTAETSTQEEVKSEQIESSANDQVNTKVAEEAQAASDQIAEKAPSEAKDTNLDETASGEEKIAKQAAKIEDTAAEVALESAETDTKK